jgi:hypothetical protein
MRVRALHMGGLLPPRAGVGASVCKSGSDIRNEAQLLDWLLRELSRWEPGEEIVLTYEIEEEKTA